VSISIETAHRVLEASRQKARELRSPVSIAIVDAGGHLVLFERMMAPYGFATGDISIAKASTAVMFNQSTDSVAQWGAGIPGFASSLAAMTDGKFIMAAGGFPLRVKGVTIGGIGISGGNAPGRDDEIAQAGLQALEMIAPTLQPVGPVAQPGPVQQPPMPPQQPASRPTQPFSQSIYTQEPIHNKSEASVSSSMVNGEQASNTSQNYRQAHDENSSRPQYEDASSYNAYRPSASPPEVGSPGDNE
jgi:uncharacterized protein GlcG (DUF336 family)